MYDLQYVRCTSVHYCTAIPVKRIGNYCKLNKNTFVFLSINFIPTRHFIRKNADGVEIVPQEIEEYQVFCCRMIWVHPREYGVIYRFIYLSSTGDAQEDGERETSCWRESGERGWTRSCIRRPQESLVLYKSFILSDPPPASEDRPGKIVGEIFVAQVPTTWSIRSASSCR